MTSTVTSAGRMMRTMVWGKALLAVLAVGCGRIGFDATGDGDGGGTGGSADGSLARGPCPPPATISDPLLISGTTIRVTVIGTLDPENDVAITALDRLGGTVLAQTTSASNGDYTLSVPSGGLPVTAVVTFAKQNLLTSLFVPEAALDRDIVGLQSWMGSSSATNSLYSVSGANRDPAMGTILVQVRDCDGGDFTGAKVSVTPAPEKIVYAGGLCAPSLAQDTTRSPCPYAWGLNVSPGTVQLSASKSGTAFLPFDVEIPSGTYFMGSVIHAVP